MHILADIMGGDVSVSSTPGEGSTFTVTLMLSRIDSTLVTPKQQASVIGYQGERKTIFVADDQPMHRSLMNDLLSPLGFTVIEAPDAKTCLGLIEEQQPDIFLLDVSMPDMDGLTLAQTLRNQDLQQPIIMISADAQEHHQIHSPNSPHNSYMVKPIKINTLLGQLGTLLNIEWYYNEHHHNNTNTSTNEKEALPSNTRQTVKWSVPSHPYIDELLSYATIGYAKGFHQTLEKIDQENVLDSALVQHLYRLAKQVRFDKVADILENT